MNDMSSSGGFGVLTEPATLTIRRVLPGPIERVWAYLTESDLRRKWLASGEMQLAVGAPFELTWRNDELATRPGKRPDGFDEESRLRCEITEFVPLSRLSFTWGSTGGVTFEVEPRGEKVLLTVTHRRIAERSERLNIGAGWHAHLDVLAATMNGEDIEPFWDQWSRLRQDYDRRLPT